MAGTSKRRKTVDVEEEEDELNNLNPGTSKQYSPDAQTKELSPPSRRRHLVISNGGAICFLDLEQSKDKQPLINADYVPPLPIIASLNLMENHLPILAGLFKVGSDAYMIGGRKHIRGLEKQPPLVGFWDWESEGELGLNGTSRAIHRLSLLADDDDDDNSNSDSSSSSNNNNNNNNATLIITSSKAPHNMKKLKSPKIWPIVEEIDGQIHVFDSAFEPWSELDCDGMFSHELLNTKAAAAASARHSWRKIGVDLPPELKGRLITSHLVLGNSIYAVMAGSGYHHLVFDSETNKWEDIGPRRQPPHPPFGAQHVWDLLENGNASCVAEFLPYYYVVIRIANHHSFSDSDYYYMDLEGVHAEAFIVRGETGEVVCSQPLPRFFQGPVQPDRMTRARVIKVDEEGKTMCAILNASPILNGCEFDSSAAYLFIYTFSVDILAGALEVAEERLHAEELVRLVRLIPGASDFTSFQACFV